MHDPDVSLCHYGIKGMRWGVRRYQNYNGSYTKMGVERYRKSDTAYENAKNRKREVRDAYKNKSATKEEYKEASQKVKSTKKILKQDYKRLKTDKLADEGRELYKKGKTIGGNTYVSDIARVSITLGSIAVSKILKSSIRDQRVANIAIGTINLGAMATNLIIAGKTGQKNKKLRAYYAH